ncbi:hypothetical protein MTR67_007258 [Solanum verrucosum]|uniref:Uncharacterized protein n=1 Tax=Solanum verrucosum TaxID=315347 RepID=A0AAF0PZG7_SOLVR|nr:hypothetical protein MTR67_007258 [Solanum verrucosum]
MVHQDDPSFNVRVLDRSHRTVRRSMHESYRSPRVRQPGFPVSWLQFINEIPSFGACMSPLGVLYAMLHLGATLGRDTRCTPRVQRALERLQERLKSGRGHRRVKSMVEAHDNVQVDAMSDQISKHTAAVAEFERRRVVEQESMSVTVHQIKEQVLNLALRPSTSSPAKDTDDVSEEDDDFIHCTP